MPPIYVKPYVKRGKTDAADAVELRLDEAERPARGIAREDRYCVVADAGGVNVRAVGAHRDSPGEVQAVDAADAIELRLDEAQYCCPRRGHGRQRHSDNQHCRPNPTNSMQHQIGKICID